MYKADGTILATKSGIKDAPSTTGVYIFRIGTDIIYIGKAVNIRARLISHFQSVDIDKKEAAIFAESTDIDYLITDSEFKALVVEAHLISTIKPKYNVRWRDDKSYLYIRIITGEAYPKVSLARGQDIKKSPNSQSTISNNDKLESKVSNCKLACDAVRVFGPFSSTYSAESVLRYLRRIVPYCTQRTISKQACFYHKIGQCDPCPNLIDHMEDKVAKSKEKRRYRANIKKLCAILEGDVSKVEKEFKRELRAYTESQDYEAAIKVRDAMRRLEFMIAHGSFRLDEYESYNKSEQSLESLMALLTEHFPQLQSLHRIECYDNSTLSFTNSTASMVVFTDGLVDKREYKKFKMKKAHDNDFDMMREIISRRTKHSDWPRPDLIIIDGGAPQLRAVIDTLSTLSTVIPSPVIPAHAGIHTQEEIPKLVRDDKSLIKNTELLIINYSLLDVPLIGIAKHPDRLILPTLSHTDSSLDPTSRFSIIHSSLFINFTSLRPRAHDLGFRLVQAIRDEAHRFAKKYHTSLRKRNQIGL
ncbi:MAG: GIY-YIG nuclease family protein [bacterium]